MAFGMSRRWVLRYAAVAGSGLLAQPLLAGHKPYPSRPVKLVVPFAAGGSADIVARLVADAMQPALGQAMVVDNKAGAGGMIGSEAIARAAADGYTVGLGSISTLVVNPILLPAARVRPMEQLQPVIPLASIASVFSLPSSLGVENFAQFVQAARAQGDNWAVGSSGIGSVGHVILQALNAQWGLQLRHIPYKGMGPVVQSVLAGQTQVLSDQFPSSAPHIAAGHLQPVAVAATARLPQLPQVPTLAELGYPQLNDLAMTWFGLVVPQGVPGEVVDRLHLAATQALEQPELRARWTQMGVQPLGGSAANLWQMVERTGAHVRALVAAGVVRADT